MDRTRMGAAASFFTQVVLPYAGDDCLTWPYARTVKGYAIVHWRQRLCSTHRVACELVHGLPPTPKHEAAHTCGNGHLGCVNPNHVRWATRKENAADRNAHGRTARGERNGAAKLTNAQARQIAELVALPNRESYSAIARRFGVSVYPVYSIAKRLKWKILPKRETERA